MLGRPCRLPQFRTRGWSEPASAAARSRVCSSPSSVGVGFGQVHADVRARRANSAPASPRFAALLSAPDSPDGGGGVTLNKKPISRARLSACSNSRALSSATEICAASVVNTLRLLHRRRSAVFDCTSSAPTTLPLTISGSAISERVSGRYGLGWWTKRASAVSSAMAGLPVEVTCPITEAEAFCQFMLDRQQLSSGFARAGA